MNCITVYTIEQYIYCSSSTIYKIYVSIRSFEWVNHNLSKELNKGVHIMNFRLIFASCYKFSNFIAVLAWTFRKLLLLFCRLLVTCRNIFYLPVCNDLCWTCTLQHHVNCNLHVRLCQRHGPKRRWNQLFYNWVRTLICSTPLINNLQDHEINNYMSTATVQCIVEVYDHGGFLWSARQLISKTCHELLQILPSLRYVSPHLLFSCQVNRRINCRV